MKRVTIEEAKTHIDHITAYHEYVPDMVLRGHRYFAPCPLPGHDDNDPSFTIDINTGRYYCHGCKEPGGDILDLVGILSWIDVSEAVELLTNGEYTVKGQIESTGPKKTTLYKLNKQVANQYHSNLMINKPLLQAVKKRGIDLDTIKLYNIGLATSDVAFHDFDTATVNYAGIISPQKRGGGNYAVFDQRIMFPISDHAGNIVGFSGRRTRNEKAKYINTKENKIFSKKNLLLGLHEAIPHIKELSFCLIVEGNFDVASLRSAGIKNVVAIVGSALTDEHCNILSRYTNKILYIPDGDEAGRKSVIKAIAPTVNNGLDLEYCELPNDTDPASLVQQNELGIIQAAISNATCAVRWAEKYITMKNGGGIAGMTKTETEIGDIFEAVNEEKRNLFMRFWKRQCGIDNFNFTNLEAEPERKEEFKTDSLTTEFPSHIIDPGGLISLGMKGMLCPGQPQYPQYPFPVVLSTIGLFGCGLISIGKIMPTFYHVKLGISRSGKSDADALMTYALHKQGLGDYLGPQVYASGPAIVNTAMAAKGGRMLSFLDEVGEIITASTAGRDSKSLGLSKSLLELHSLNGTRYLGAYADKEKNPRTPWFCFGFVGSTVIDATRGLSQASFKSGLMSRTNFFAYDGKQQKRGVFSGELPDELREFTSKLYNLSKMEKHHNGDHERGGAFSLSINEVAWRLEEIGDFIVKTVNDSDGDDIIATLVSEIYNDTLRYALVKILSSRELYRIYDPVEIDDIEYGFELAKILAFWKLEKLYPTVSNGEYDEDCKIFLSGLKACYQRYLQKKEGRPTKKSIITKRKGKTKNWNLKRWQEITELLVETGEIRVEFDRGKEYYFPI
jgi:DNA primase